MMNWEKLGKIFDPRDHVLPDNSKEFAQSPQTLVFDDFVRIYFSTRAADSNGMFLSNIAYTDFSKDLRRIIGVSRKAVIPLGELGTFDEHGIFPINPYKDGDRILAYTCGWSRRVSVSVETSIGVVYSDDNGDTFKRFGTGPILSSSVSEPVLVGDGFVRKYGDTYHMWYIFGKTWIKATDNEPPARVYKIAYATSNDGINWDKQEGKQIISDVIDANECQALPTVVELDGVYHMVFCFRHSSDFRTNPKRGYKLGYASSTDLKNWERDDAKLNFNLPDEGWDSEMMCYPHLFKVDNSIYMLYNGNNFGRFGFGAAKLLSIS
jgi:hypothetical protein